MDLRLTLDDIRFAELTEAARAMIPSLAPDWTDHNAHDPGIMLIELMACLADAQIYSLARTRRDERLGYARLLGVTGDGPRPASGLVWPLAPGGPGRFFAAGTPVIADDPAAPAFRTVADQHLSAAVLIRVTTLLAHGAGTLEIDQTAVNAGDRASYLPFGKAPTPRDRLVLAFDGLAIAPESRGAFVLGVETDFTTGTDGCPGALRVSMRDASGERPVRVAEDTTRGLSRTGVIRLAIDPGEQVTLPPGAPARFDLILAPRPGSPMLLPRIRRIAPNAVPVEQLRAEADEVAGFGKALPGQTHDLRTRGLVGGGPLSVTLDGEPFARRPDLAACDPGEPAYVLDAGRDRLRFGNGINGRMPPLGAALRVAYDVSSGAAGNLAAGTAWTLAGFPGPFGRTSQPCADGRDPPDLDDLRIAARRRLGARAVLVTPSDLEAAAMALADLRVAGARELGLAAGDLPGTRRLVVRVAADPERTPGAAAETPPWVAAVRARLAPRLLAGERLEVVGPTRVGVGLAARLGIDAGADAARVADEVRAAVRARFVDEAGEPAWPLGRQVTELAVRGWLRQVAGVRTVSDLRLLRDGAARERAVALEPTELAWLEEPVALSIERLPVGDGR